MDISLGGKAKTGGVKKDAKLKVQKIAVSLTPKAYEIYQTWPEGMRSKIISELIERKRQRKESES